MSRDGPSPVERLRDDSAASPRIVALPDGSLDRFCAAHAGAGTRIATRARLGVELTRGKRKSLRLEPYEEAPGGQAVNLGWQAHRLGADVSVYGHLDGVPALPFDATSMGRAARVDVCRFADGDLMLADESGDLRDWGLNDLRAAAGDLGGVADADAVCWLNWVSVPNTTDAVERFVDVTDPDGEPLFLVDAGDVVGSDAEAFAAFRDAFRAVSDSDYRLVLTANRAEVRAYMGALLNYGGGDAGGDASDEWHVRRLREVLGCEAVVLHAPDVAVAASPDGQLTVENRDLASRARETGGGDRFGGALAYALTAGWGWREACELANVAASRYIATGDTGDRATLADWLARPGAPGERGGEGEREGGGPSGWGVTDRGAQK
ncbi:hypothetical protein [Halobaculum sp. P14]|uniref:hypothetical protein n=1 Tax=Halobaculum sp. P14 TaxID=3421638 RepID=UPI003EC13414